jgi:hypothetical protein
LFATLQVKQKQKSKKHQSACSSQSHTSHNFPTKPVSKPVKDLVWDFPSSSVLGEDSEFFLPEHEFGEMMRNKDLPSYSINSNVLESRDIRTPVACSAKENIMMNNCSSQDFIRTGDCEYSKGISSDLDYVINHPHQLGLEFCSEQFSAEPSEPVDVAGEKTFSQPVGINGFVYHNSKSRRRWWLRPRRKRSLLMTDYSTPFQAATASLPEEASTPNHSAAGTVYQQVFISI